MDSDNLMQALYAMDWERIKAKLNTGADVNAPYNKHGWTPFMWACREFYELEAIETFLAAGVMSTPVISMRKRLLSLQPSTAVRHRHYRFCSRPERISTRRINSATQRLFIS